MGYYRTGGGQPTSMLAYYGVATGFASLAALEAAGIRGLKTFLRCHGVSVADVNEKAELLAKAGRLHATLETGLAVRRAVLARAAGAGVGTAEKDEAADEGPQIEELETVPGPKPPAEGGAPAAVPTGGPPAPAGLASVDIESIGTYVGATGGLGAGRPGRERFDPPDDKPCVQQ